MAKRVRVFGDWLNAVRNETGKSQLQVLDFGCGTGGLVTSPLGRSGDRILGVDVHLPSIEQARDRNSAPNVTYSTEGTKELTARNARFDVIICSEVLEHLPDPAALICELNILLQPGGTLIVSVPNGRGVFERAVQLENVMHSLGVEAVIDFLKWPFRALKWRIAGRGWPPKPGRPRELSKYADAGFLNLESPHLHFFSFSEILGIMQNAGFDLDEYRGRTLACGPYIGPLLNIIAALSGHWIFSLNNWLGDHASTSVVSDWMFRMRKR